MPFAENLRFLKDSLNLTNYRFAKELQCSQTAVKSWLDGSNLPHTRTRVKIAEYFGISLAELDGDALPILPVETPPALEIKKDITGNGDVLSPLEAELMRYVRGLSEEQKRFLLAQMQLLKQQESPSADS